MAPQATNFLTSRYAPDPDGEIVAATDHGIAVGSDSTHGFPVPLKDAQCM